MYIVKIKNNDIITTIHDDIVKISEGKIVKGINTIDSFTFLMNRANPGYNKVEELKTIVSVFNERTKKYEFWGRVLTTESEMEDDGRLTEQAVAESFLGFFTDSIQEYVKEKNWTPAGLLNHIIDNHNKQVEAYKQFRVGTVNIQEDNIFIGIQRDDTWKTIQEKLIDKAGGEINFRRENDVNYIDWITQVGTKKATSIEVGKNMKKITCEHDPTEYISRLIPLGAKLKDENNKETEERLSISKINDGKNYIESAEAMNKFGIRYKIVCFDDVHEADILKRKGEKYLIDNNRVKIKYSIDALDLQLLGIDIDSMEVGNIHPIQNKYLGINDEARIVKKTIDILNETKKSIELGERFKTLSELRNDDKKESENIINRIEKIESDYVINETVKQAEESASSSIQQKVDELIFLIESEHYTKEQTQELLETISTEFSQTEEGFSMQFNELKKLVDENGSKIEESNKYIDFINGQIVIGNNQSPLTAVHTNESIEFRYNDITIAEFTPEGLDARNAAVDNRVSFFGQWSIQKGAENGNGYNLNDVWIG